MNVFPPTNDPSFMMSEGSFDETRGTLVKRALGISVPVPSGRHNTQMHNRRVHQTALRTGEMHDTASLVRTSEG